MGKADRVYNKPWRYALTMFGLSIIGYMYGAYGAFYYNDKIGLSMTMIGMGSVFFAVWDAFNDPLAGFLSDRTRTRWGRRKPWLLTSIPVFALSSILFFCPPSSLGTGIGMAVYFTAFLMLTETSNTIASVNYHALLPELFRENDKRNRANAIRQALQLVGMIIGVSLVPAIAAALGYSLTAVILAALGAGLVIYSVLGCKERSEFSELPQPKLFTSLKAVVKNRNFWRVSVSHFFYQATTALLLASIPFYIKYALGLADIMATILSACVFVTAIPAMFLWYKLINRYGTLLVWRAALLWLGLSIIPMFFASGIGLAYVAGALMGIGIAGVTANLDMVNSELIEADAAASGQRREGTFFASISFITRLSGLARSGAFILLVVLFGFESSDHPGSNPALATRFLMGLFPVILMLFSFLVSLTVTFNKRKDA